VHVGVGQSLVKQAPELCYDCHSDVRAASYMPSHHPVAEGVLTCQDCHNPHGGEVTFAMNDDGRELCFSCHADKEGPFLYEHAPVNEDCMLCHTPHGSVADNLLIQSEPALCLNCHAMHFHGTVEGVDGPFSTPQAPERAGISTPDGFKQAMLTKCTQCHTEIHGSDMPSQSRSTGGNALTR
jgi:DmsE family decaheme c-type cytochrome